MNLAGLCAESVRLSGGWPPWCHAGVQFQKNVPVVSQRTLLSRSPTPTPASTRTVMAVLAERRTRLGGVVVRAGADASRRLPVFWRGSRRSVSPSSSTPTGLARVLRGLLADGALDIIAHGRAGSWEKYAALAGVACDETALRRVWR
jgi:hypothetical protein